MKAITGLWFITMVMGLWLLFAQPTQAFDIWNCHHLHPNDAQPQAIGFSLPEIARSQFQIKLMASQLDTLDGSSIDCFRLSGQAGIDACHCAIAANPGSAVAWNNLGQKLFRLGRYTDALVAYDHALLISPDYSLSLANRCGVLSRLGEYEQALISCDLALQGNGAWGVQGSALAWDNRGDALFNLERYQESLQSFNQALAVNPDYTNAQRNRAIVLHQLQKIAELSGE